MAAEMDADAAASGEERAPEAGQSGCRHESRRVSGLLEKVRTLSRQFRAYAPMCALCKGWTR